MDRALAVALAVNVVADEMAGGHAPNEVVVLCVCCVNEQDPHGEWSLHRAPAHAQCMACSSEKRQREGMVFAVRPRQGVK